MLKTFEWVAVMAVVVLLLSIAGISYLSSPQHGQPREQQVTTQAEAEKQDEKQHSLRGFIRFMFPDAISIFTFWLTLATIALGVVAILQIGFLDRSERISTEAAKAAKDAADVAKSTLIASQRAWIRIDEIGLGGGALAFDENGASVSVSFKITNVGNSPATNITPHAWLIALKNGGPFAIQEQQRLCSEIRKTRFGIGFTIFPGETFPTNLGFGSWSLGTNISAEEIKRGLETSSNKEHIALQVFGCVDYTFGTDPTVHHQTGFIRDLRMSGPNLLRPAAGNVPIDQLSLSDSGIGMGQYAD